MQRGASRESIEKEINPGNALIIKKNGELSQEEIIEPLERKSCSFERIYFSRGNDADIYNERNKLGRNLTQSVLKSVNHDLENTVFSYIPNTAEVAFGGLVEGIDEYVNKTKTEQIIKLKNNLSDVVLPSCKAVSSSIPLSFCLSWLI